MQLLINRKTYTVPFDLSNITLGEYCEYYDQFGRDLDTELEVILARKYNEEPELNLTVDVQNHVDKEALAWLSYWTSIGIDVLSNSKATGEYLSAYQLMRYQMKEQEESAKKFPLTIKWNNEEWEIQDFVVDPASGMTFNEVITSRELMRQLGSMSRGKWEMLRYMACIFFRKKDEPYSDDLILDGGERMLLLNDLPLTHALSVGFFLISCANIYQKTSASLDHPEEETTSQN